MAAMDNVNPEQFFHGYAPVKRLVVKQGTSPKRIAELAGVDDLPPIAAAWGGGETIMVQNGNHRTQAAKRQKTKEIPAYVKSRWGAPPIRDAREVPREEYEQELNRAWNG